MDYKNPSDCLALLHDLSMEDFASSQATMQDMLSTLAADPPPLEQYLEILESCREPLAAIQLTAANTYAKLPLPPEGDENDVLLLVVSLWRLMARSYSQIARRAEKENALATQRALLAQRHLFYTGYSIFEYYRSHRTLPPGRWAELHEGYRQAEAQDVGHIRVSDPLNHVWNAQSPCEAFTTALLVDLGNPFGRNEQEFDWLCRWAQRFAPYCTLKKPSEGGHARAATYGLNLDSDFGLRPIGVLKNDQTLRRFDGSELANQFHAILNQFKQGVQPATLGLGDDCSIDNSARLLLSLYRPWGLGSVGRRFPRRGAQGQVEITGDWFLLTHHIGGSLNELPGQQHHKSKKINQMIASSHSEREAQNFNCERWELVNQSVNGFRLRIRPKKERFSHHQLVAIRPPANMHFMLGQVSWLMFRDDGLLESGIMLLSENPQLISCRQSPASSSNVEDLDLTYRQAFWLPQERTFRQPESLVLPRGLYPLGTVLDIESDNGTWSARLDKILVHGANFEQFTYSRQQPRAGGDNR